VLDGRVAGTETKEDSSMRTKLAGSIVTAVVAAAMAFTADATARAKFIPLFREFSTGRILEPGASLQLKASNLLITTSAGNISCEDGRFVATLQNNGFNQDGFLVTSAVFHDAHGGPCTSTTPFGAATITSEPPNGDWPGQARSSRGTAKVTGPIVLKVVFEAQPGQTLTCTWSGPRIRFTFIPNGQPIKAMVSNAKFKRAAGISTTCPKAAFLSAVYNMTTPEPGAMPPKNTPVSMS
jgi:hypothetical protein